MNYLEHIRTRIKNLDQPVILALAGDERALIDDCLKSIRQTCLSEGDSSLNYDKFNFNEANIEEIFTTLNIVPFGARYKLVEIYEAEKINAQQAKLFLEYINNPSNFTVLVFIFNKQDKRNKLLEFFKKNNLLFEFNSLSGGKISNWIIAHGKENNVILDINSAEFLGVLLNNNLVGIKSALTKLALVFRDKAPSINEIADHVCEMEAHDGFRWAQAVFKGDIGESLILLGKLRNSKENALKLLGLLVWNFRMIVQIRQGMDVGRADWEIRNQVRIFGYRYDMMVHVARKNSFAYHVNRLTRLLDHDRALKGQSPSHPFSILERIVYQSAAGMGNF